MLDQLEIIRDRYYRLEEQLGDPEIVADNTRFSKIHKEYKDLQPLMDAYRKYQLLLGNIANAQETLKDDDEEMRQMAKEELDTLETDKETLEAEIKILLIPQDPEDEKDVIFEIRSGTGGDEASLFAGDLYRMYTRYFDQQGWKTEVIAANEGSVGGFNKIVLEVKGENVYGKLKFESGAHRVQRVPETESKGRVHTSAATVAVIPEFEQEEININKADLRVDTFRASGAGGQHVNKTESGVRFTHIPTGLVAESTEDRSQFRNREIAMQRLYFAITEMQRKQFESEATAQRKSLVGSGDRSDKIRTYNFPQNRVTDHRIDLTLYKLDRILEGEIGEIIEGLQLAERNSRMEEMENA